MISTSVPSRSRIASWSMPTTVTTQRRDWQIAGANVGADKNLRVKMWSKATGFVATGLAMAMEPSDVIILVKPDREQQLVIRTPSAVGSKLKPITGRQTSASETVSAGPTISSKCCLSP